MNRIIRTMQWSALVIGMTVLLVVAGLTAHDHQPTNTFSLRSDNITNDYRPPLP